MSSTPVLATQPRAAGGSANARRERAAGRVPVNVYGHGQGNVSATVDAHDLGQALSTTAQVFTLQIDGKDESCLVKEVQYDTFGQIVLHVDLARIDLDEEVSVTVALEFIGNAVGLSDGGVQVVHRPILPVRCPAGVIPDEIRVNVSALAVGDTLTAADLELPEKVVLDDNAITPGEAVVGVIKSKKVVKAASEDEDAEGEAADGEAGEGDAAEGGDKPADGDGGEG